MLSKIQATKSNGRYPRVLIISALLTILIICGAWSLLSGAVQTNTNDLWGALYGETTSEFKNIVIREIRLPRLITALMVGLALTLSGTLLQGLFRNPLADPGLIGISSGGAIGAVIAIVCLPALVTRLAISDASANIINWLGLPILAMASAIGLTFIIYRLSLIRGRTNVPAMLLTGLAVNSIGGAFVGLVVTIFSSDEQLRTITFWTLGSLSGSNWGNTVVISVCVLIPAIVAMTQGRALNALLLGENEAFHLGINIQKTKRTIIITSAIMVGTTVAFCGIIGFVGLVVPHMLRTLFGPDHRLLIPAGAILGAITLITADIFARTILAPAEIQIGILTAIIGGPFFLVLLIRARSRGTILSNI